MKAKETVRAKRARVNSVFLVQLRKKMATVFCGLTGMKWRLRDECFTRWMAGVLTQSEQDRKNLVEWAAGMSTGRAQEMQKGSAVGSGEFSVLGLSSQFGGGSLDPKSCLDGCFSVFVVE
jgi:hypothetical protein